MFNSYLLKTNPNVNYFPYKSLTTKVLQYIPSNFVARRYKYFNLLSLLKLFYSTLLIGRHLDIPGGTPDSMSAELTSPDPLAVLANR